MTTSIVSWSTSVWFFDIDDTLIDTAGTSVQASSGIYTVFQQHFTETVAARVQKNFNDIFNVMMAGYRVKSETDWSRVPGGKFAFEQVYNAIEMCQQHILSRYGGIKKWSREVLIKLAADRAGLAVTPEIIQEAANSYWVMLTEQTVVLPGVLELFAEIRSHNRPIYFITSSDARLTMREDGQFDYNPAYSEQLKRERIERLRAKGLDFNLVTIGDPEDKPHRIFFEKGIRAAEKDLGFPIDLSQAIMVGDSFAGDLQTPKEILHFGLVVLFQKEGSDTTMIDFRQLTTNNLFEIVRFLKV